MVTNLPDTLEVEIHLPISKDCRAGIISSFWPSSTFTKEDLERTPAKLATYFQYYSQQRQQFLDDSIRVQQLVLTKTHRDIAKIAEGLKSGSSKENITEQLRPKAMAATDETIDQLLSDTIDFVARLLVMVDFRQLRPGDRILGQQPQTWLNGTLFEALASVFNGTTKMDTPVRLERVFTAPNVELIGDINILWTDNLADHLKMSDDDTKVAIFGHVQFLNLAKDGGLLPPGLAEETLQTLALLFPRRDAEVKRWFKRQQRLSELEYLTLDEELINGQRLTPNERQISNFKYWHDRLIILKQAFDEAQPKNLRQWWSDQRNPVQWYNFWVAVGVVVSLTVFFGLAQTILGALQVYKAYHPA